ncbi:hypothetical protein [Peterkaempfera sp. SMS 1(5)a]|uniref:hypothetical protein n=1 Tax=Peterkaempfera podocarpi TaxID=3232308 RepID=UPI00367234C1
MTYRASDVDEAAAAAAQTAREEDRTERGRYAPLLDWLTDGGLPALTLGVVPPGPAD